MSRLSRRFCDYLKGVTDKYGLRRYIRFNSHVDRAHWDDAEYRWHVFTDGRAGVRRAVPDLRRGRTAHPAIPDIEGSTNSGPPLFHSAQWDHGVDLTGKRVAVIGTGASAIQIVPEIVEDVARTAALPAHPAWVMPRPNNAVPGVAASARSPTCPGSRLRCATGIYWFHEGLGFAMTKRPELLQGRSSWWASGTSAATSRTRNCAAS